MRVIKQFFMVRDIDLTLEGVMLKKKKNRWGPQSINSYYIAKQTKAYNIIKMA